MGFPFNIDCWVLNLETKCRIITHFHGDHLPCYLPARVVVPFEVKYLSDRSEHQYERLQRNFDEQKLPKNLKIEQVGKLRHLGDFVAVLKITDSETSKEYIVIGDYDAPAGKELVRIIVKEKPDTMFLPIYSKYVSSKYGRAQELTSSLYETQKWVIKEIKKRSSETKIIGLAHSEKARGKGLGLHGFFSFKRRIPSLDDYRQGFTKCGSTEFCKGCQRAKNGHRRICSLKHL